MADPEDYRSFDITEIPKQKLCSHIMVAVKVADGVVNPRLLEKSKLLQQVQYIRKNHVDFEVILSLYDDEDSKVDFEDYLSDSVAQDKLTESVVHAIKHYNFTGFHLQFQNFLSRKSKIYSKSLDTLQTFIKMFSATCRSNNWTFDATIISPFAAFLKNGYFQTIRKYFRYAIFKFDIENFSATSHQLPVNSLESLIAMLNEEKVDKQGILVEFPGLGTVYVFNTNDTVTKEKEYSTGISADLLAYRQDLNGSGYSSYAQTCYDVFDETSNWKLYKDTVAQAMILSEGSQWITLETSSSISQKVQYFLKQGIFGFGISNVAADDYNGRFCGQQYPLLKSIVNVVNGNLNCTPVDKDGGEAVQEYEGNESYESVVIVPILLVSLGFFLVLACALCIITIRMRRKSQKELSNKQESSATRNSKEDIVPKELLEFEIPAHEYQTFSDIVLGQGQSSIVLRGKILTQDVAVKIPKRNAIVKHTISKQFKEVDILKDLIGHECVIGLLGICTRMLAKGYVYVFLEKCALGSLDKYMRQHRNSFHNLVVDDDLVIPVSSNCNQTSTPNISQGQNTFNTKTLISWTHQICEGMNYIASKQIIHGDLAARNILLTSVDCIKICDFGMATRLNVGEEEREIFKNRIEQDALPWRWMALECLDKGTVSTTSDVWSYGVTIWEIFSLGEVPYAGLEWNSDFASKLRLGLKLPVPRFATTTMFTSFILPCWNVSYKDRPNFAAIKDSLVLCTNDNLSTGYEAFEITENADIVEKTIVRT